MTRRPAAALRRFARDEHGSITIEFMLWVPLLALWLVFSVAVFDAYVTRNQAAKAAHTLADIISRKETWSDADFQNLYLLEGKLLTHAEAGRALRVTTVERIVDDYVVSWSSASQGLDPLTDATFPVSALPAMLDGDQVVYTEVLVPWTPFANVPGLTAHTWDFGIASRPRLGDIELAMP